MILMINTQEILDDLHSPIKIYTGIDQLIQNSQNNIPKEEMQYPHIVYGILDKQPGSDQKINFYELQNVPSDEEFDNDVEYTYTQFPNFRLDFEVFGKPKNNISNYIQKVQNFFSIDKLADRWFKQNGYPNINVSDIGPIENRTVILEEKYQERFGVTITLKGKEEVKIKEKTIEQLNLNTKPIKEE